MDRDELSKKIRKLILDSGYVDEEAADETVPEILKLCFGEDQDLVKVTLVPVEVFGADSGYGLMDAVTWWSDCNRAIGHIFRRDEEDSVPFRDPSEVITVYVPRSELPKFDKKWNSDGDSR